jgi:hypothetical protein
MSQAEIEARHLVELGFLEEIVTRLGLRAQVVEKSAEVPYHTLLVELDPDHRGRPMQLAISFYPVGADLVAHTLLLQYFIALPFSTDAAGLARVRAWLPAANNRVVLGHFGLSTGEGQVHYRYVQALPEEGVVGGETVGDVLTLVRYTPLLFAEALEDLAVGHIGPEEAEARVEARLRGE